MVQLSKVVVKGFALHLHSLHGWAIKLRGCLPE